MPLPQSTGRGRCGPAPIQISSPHSEQPRRRRLSGLLVFVLACCGLGGDVWARPLASSVKLPSKSVSRPRPAPVPLKPAPAPAQGIRGFADLHTHQFANLAFGGWAVAGEPYGPAPSALRWCNRQQQHGAGGLADVMGNLVRLTETGKGPLGHKVGGYPQFDGWPVWSSVSHQQMWEQWLLRAHRGGLQLMVMHAVNNGNFCKNAHKKTGRTCDDQEAIRLQLAAAKAMEADIDRRSGGPGLGWYRIVYSPQQARAAIAKGQLAVVLGIEVDNPFPKNDPKAAFDQLQAYYAAGVRHVFPVHFMNNTVGGASYDKSLAVPRGTPLAPALGKLMHPYEMDVRDCRANGYRRQGGKCNALGLLPLGRNIIYGLMSKGMMIDVDHMSELTFNAVLDLADSNHYPVISGHTGFVDLALGAADQEKSHEGNLTAARLERIRRSGGMVAIILNQGNYDQISTYRGGPVVVPHTCGNTSETIAQAYLYAISKAPGMPVGLGSDMNAFLSMPGPRFGNDACPGGKAPHGPNPNRIMYPFTALASGVKLDRSIAVENDPKVTRRFDFSTDGMAHIGLLPDLIEDLRRLGVRDQDLEPLLSSAEGYIRSWERAAAHRPSENSACADARRREHALENQINAAKAQVQAIQQAQQACQSGADVGDGVRKPRQCITAQDRQRSQQYQQQARQLQSQLPPILAEKRRLGCWY